MTALLIYATLWLIIGLSILLAPILMPGAPHITVLNTNFSFGWFALLISGFYLFRWYLARQRRQFSGFVDKKRSQIREESDKEVTDPEFAFDDDLPKPTPSSAQQETDPASGKKRIKHPEFAFEPDPEEDTDRDDNINETRPDDSNGEPK